MTGRTVFFGVEAFGEMEGLSIATKRSKEIKLAVSSTKQITPKELE